MACENTIVIELETGHFVTFRSRNGKAKHSAEYPDAILMTPSDAYTVAKNLSVNGRTFKAISKVEFDADYYVD